MIDDDARPPSSPRVEATPTAVTDDSGVPAAEEAVAAIGRGELVVLRDDRLGRDEGSIALAADFATAERIHAIGQMAGSGMTVLCLADNDCKRLELVPIDGGGESVWRATISIDHPSGHPPGSADGRAATIAAAIDPASDPGSFRRPGHVTPTRAVPHGALERPGRTEAAVELARMAGRRPAAVLTLILNEDGSAARAADLVRFCRRHRLPVVTTTAVTALRWRTDPALERVAHTLLPTRYGSFEALGYCDRVTGESHLALVRGDLRAGTPPLVRIQRRCFATDVLRTTQCACAGELEQALRLVGGGRGLLVYLLSASGLHELVSCSSHGEDPVGEQRLTWMAAHMVRDVVGSSTVEELIGGAGGVDGLAAAGVNVVARRRLDGREALVRST